MNEWTRRIAELEAENAELKSALNLFGDDPAWCEILVEKCAEIIKLREELSNHAEHSKFLADSNAALTETNQQLAEDLTKAIPDDVRLFIYFVTIFLQASRSKTPDQMDAMFQRAYALYVKYDVEGKKAEATK